MTLLAIAQAFALVVLAAALVRARGQLSRLRERFRAVGQRADRLQRDVEKERAMNWQLLDEMKARSLMGPRRVK